MQTFTRVLKNTYFDSVTLMVLSSRINNLEGIANAAIMMGSPNNIELMNQSNLISDELIDSISTNDLVIGFSYETDEQKESVQQLIDDFLEHKTTSQETADSKEYETIESVLQDSKPNLVSISIPGQYATLEALNALNNGMHVFMFSDNVSIENELRMKDLAIEKNLLMMGPDCGTAIINGVGLGFFNIVRKGDIGLIGASGTGLQEVTVLINRFNEGISQAIGIGGRDLKEEIGGLMMLEALDALENDDETSVIGLISKPPEKSVLKKIYEKVETLTKPVFACFIGSTETQHYEKLSLSKDLESLAIEIVKHKRPDFTIKHKELRNNQDIKGKYIRGLFTGGTLAYEAMTILQEKNIDCYSNIPLNSQYKLDNNHESKSHTVLDMGDDFFTKGKPHPMIDPSLRNLRIIEEYQNPDVRALLLDCVIGEGSHENPAQEIAKSLSTAKNNSDHHPLVICSICGTEEDPQVYSLQESILQEHGVIICESNAQAARYAAIIANKEGV